MKKLVKWVKSYLGISRSESNGFVVLISLMLLTTVAIFWYSSRPNPLTSDYDQSLLDSLLLTIEKNARIDSTNAPPKFYTKDKKYNAADKKKKKANQYKPWPKPDYKRKNIVKFDINKADTLQLKQLKGIGPVLSRRIVRYRNVLGGFVNLDQLAEVYGLKDSVLTQLDSMVFISPEFRPKMININTTTLDSLSRHPYIKKSIARAINNYRFQHGDYSSSTELSNIQLLDSLTLIKITPYISY